jgi:hypothetical protein
MAAPVQAALRAGHEPELGPQRAWDGKGTGNTAGVAQAMGQRARRATRRWSQAGQNEVPGARHLKAYRLLQLVVGYMQGLYGKISVPRVGSQRGGVIGLE